MNRLCVTFLLLGSAGALFPGTTKAQARSAKIIYSFKGGSDGASPYASLIADAAGNLSTTTANGGAANAGTVVRLSPPAAGQTTWTEKVLYSFKGGADGKSPRASLIADAAGNLYTTTLFGGASKSGTIVKLSPPAAGQTAWTETVIYSFSYSPNSQEPNASLIADAAGNLYTTTSISGSATPHGRGSVVKLSPPAAGKAAWTESLLYTFTGAPDGAAPYASLIADAAGNLYTTTGGGGSSGIGGGGNTGNGTIVKLSPPAAGETAWTESVLYSFKGAPDGAFPVGGLIADAAGNLYTTTYQGGAANRGTIVKLSPPITGQTAWTATVLHCFPGPPDSDGAYPAASLIADAAGNLYTTTTANTVSGGTEFYGSVVKLSPPHSGQTAWKETVFHVFSVAQDPQASLIADAAGNLYTTTTSGGSKNNGAVVEITP